METHDPGRPRQGPLKGIGDGKTNRKAGRKAQERTRRSQQMMILSRRPNKGSGMRTDSSNLESLSNEQRGRITGLSVTSVREG
jgi:hypothetical protein